METGSSTSTVQLRNLERPPTPKDTSLLNTEGHRLGSNADATGGLPAPTTTAAVVQKWNHPRSNMFRVLSCFWSMLVSGANDAAYGLEKYYDLTYIVVSLVFLSPFVGYVLSALLNNHIHLRWGQRGIAVLASSCHIVAYVIISQHPPYPALVVVFILAGFGNGLSDAGWNAYIGNMGRANEVLGFLHACYGAGGVISPLIATTMINKGNLGWWTFYYVMIGLAFIELVWCTTAFWTQTGAVYRETISHSSNDGNAGLRTALFKRPYARVSWISALFLLAYVGTEVSLGAGSSSS
ncbi:bypass of stop codon protein 6 [Colletotrichum liriopes]|uniref:Bypass of stop codon protein 6 n=1 Tax=Colletotrichum liriopes TaxID=708192 RepID=A0AA37GIQ0_9PEZI|nr:bypass of stop codon protein 6 [Colletotrichum liriopes]